MINALQIREPSPAHRVPLVFDSPHSGRNYPKDFAYACPFDELIGAEDNHVEELFEAAPSHGAALIQALFPRTYIDVNRAADDIDYELLAAPRPHTTNKTGRSHAGIGLIRRLVRPGIPVYNRSLTMEEVQHRVETYYQPYHRALAAILERAHYDYGQVWHINCHSMPSGITRKLPHRILASQPDFVLGDRDGTSCDISFRNEVERFLIGLGYRVAINDPYKGVEILRRYGKPSKGFYSLQLEINKKLYWDEINNVKAGGFNDLKADIESLISFCSAWVTHAIDQPLAAD